VVEIESAMTSTTLAQLTGVNFTKTAHSTTYDYISPLKLDLTGRNVLVTGAARENGIGFAIAIAFARAGASAIAVADLDGVTDDLIAKLTQAAVAAGRRKPVVYSFKLDITKQDSVIELKDAIVKAFGGRLDILVNNAGHLEPYKPILDSDLEVYWRTWEVNVHGLFYMAHTFLPDLLSTYSSDQGLGTVINLSSAGALSVRPGGGGYRTSKLAVLRWTEFLHADYSALGLLTYCVHPGGIMTELAENMPSETHSALTDDPRVAGDTITWLAAERKEWLGGRYVSCLWDMEEFVEKKDEILKYDKLKMRMVF
jgi:NAD(P)-dependent dehydrogenase (short-subunit alcohol dehydrogenase family)